MFFFMKKAELFKISEEEAEEYARIRRDLEKQGQLIGSMEMLIAAHAKSLGITLVTADRNELDIVPGIRPEISRQKGAA